jgi:hypothetical protein
VSRPLAALGFALGFLAFWFVGAITELPLPWYLPLEHRWAFGATVTTLGMDYFGRLLGASLLGAAGAAAGAALGRRGATERWVRDGSIWVLSLAALNALLQCALLITRHPVPIR